jgi:hypothetical protein
MGRKEWKPTLFTILSQLLRKKVLLISLAPRIFLSGIPNTDKSAWTAKRKPPELYKRLREVPNPIDPDIWLGIQRVGPKSKDKGAMNQHNSLACGCDDVDFYHMAAYEVEEFVDIPYGMIATYHRLLDTPSIHVKPLKIPIPENLWNQHNGRNSSGKSWVIMVPGKKRILRTRNGKR